MSKTTKKALKDGLVYFLAYCQFKKGRQNHKLLGKVKFISEDVSKDLLYMYEAEKCNARVLAPNGVGKNIKLEVYEMQEEKLIELQKTLRLDSCKVTTKEGITGFILVDQPFSNSLNLQKGSIDDC